MILLSLLLLFTDYKVLIKEKYSKVLLLLVNMFMFTF